MPMAGIAQLHVPDNETITRDRIHARDELARRATTDPWWMKGTVLVLSIGFMLIIFGLPLAIIFQEALVKGWAAYAKAFHDKGTVHSVWLTLQVAAIAVPLNTLFGL